MSKNALVGKWFHSPARDETGEITGVNWQGQILDEPSPGTFLVQLYEWIGGSATMQQLVPFTDMADWIFYDSDEDMKFSYDHGEANRWMRLGEEKEREAGG